MKIQNNSGSCFQSDVQGVLGEFGFRYYPNGKRRGPRPDRGYYTERSHPHPVSGPGKPECTRMDIFIWYHTRTVRLQETAIECKYQESAGTAWEKTPYACRKLAKLPYHGLLVYGGVQYSPKILHKLGCAPHGIALLSLEEFAAWLGTQVSPKTSRVRDFYYRGKTIKADITRRRAVMDHGARNVVWIRRDSQTVGTNRIERSVH